MHLSNIMPELTETELRHKGMYTVEYFDNRLLTVVSASYQSVDSYIENNGLPKTEQYRKTVVSNIGRYGYHSDYGTHGHHVRIMS